MYELTGTGRHIQLRATCEAETASLFTVKQSTHLAHDWGVDDGGQRLQVVDDDVVEQRDIVAEQLGQDEVLAWAHSTTASGGEKMCQSEMSGDQIQAVPHLACLSPCPNAA